MPTDETKFSWKLFLLKFVSRSFLSAIIGLCGFLALAFSWGPENIDALWKVGVIIGGLSGIFPMSQLVEGRNGKK